MLPLTKRQKEILDYITQYITEHDYAPTFREIAQHFNFQSLATVADHIETLKNKGFLQSSHNLARSLVINHSSFEQGIVPLLGLIAAGEPIEAIRTNETIDIPRDMAGPNVFALKVKGDSMVKDGILEGDYVIIQKTNQAQNGDIVVALIDGENATLKRYYQEKDHIRLQPANNNYQPIRTKKVLVQGKVKGVIRKFK